MTVNRWLDVIPRTRVRLLGRPAPAFRTCGIIGYYLALLVVLGAGALSGRSLLALAAASSLCALSFFAYAQLRKWLTGQERLVLLEHVWVALACSAGLFWALEVPVLAHLDVVAAGLSFFLASGRVGCLMVGCCHGHPTNIGVRYGADAVRDGFPQHLRGVRLFPVQLIEAAALGFLGCILVVIVSFGAAGQALTTFLLGYAIVRFGLESLRGDARPHWLGLSQARWMAVAELLIVLVLPLRQSGASLAQRGVLLTAALSGLGFAVLLVHLLRSARRVAWLLRSEHANELKQLVTELTHEASERPQAGVTSGGVNVAVSPLADADPLDCSRATLPLGVSLQSDQLDMSGLCTLARRAGLWRSEAARVLANGALLLGPAAEPSARGERRRAESANAPQTIAPNGRAAYFAPRRSHN